MTILTSAPTALRTLRPVGFDLYRDIHKAIRTELFRVTAAAGRLDPAGRVERQALAGDVDGLVALLVSHAEHEDGHIQPALEVHLPLMAEEVEADHARLEARMSDLQALAVEAVEAQQAATARHLVHSLYVELASFTSAYLLHQDAEERTVMPALEQAVGVEAVAAIHGAILASIPPDELAAALAIMFPAMNVDDLTEMLGGMRAGAPQEVFEGVWALAGSVLAPADLAALGARLGLG